MPIFKDDMTKFYEQFGGYDTLIDELNISEVQLDRLLKSGVFEKDKVEFKITPDMFDAAKIDPYLNRTKAEKEIFTIFNNKKWDTDNLKIKNVDNSGVTLEVSPLDGFAFLKEIFKLSDSDIEDMLEGN